MQAIFLLSFFRLLKSTLLNPDNMLSIPTTPMKLSLKDPWLFLSGQPLSLCVHLLRLFFTPCLKLIFLWLGTLFLLFLSFLGFLPYFWLLTKLMFHGLLAFSSSWCTVDRNGHEQFCGWDCLELGLEGKERFGWIEIGRLEKGGHYYQENIVNKYKGCDPWICDTWCWQRGWADK